MCLRLGKELTLSQYPKYLWGEKGEGEKTNRPHLRGKRKKKKRKRGGRQIRGKAREKSTISSPAEKGEGKAKLNRGREKREGKKGGKVTCYHLLYRRHKREGGKGEAIAGAYKEEGREEKQLPDVKKGKRKRSTFFFISNREKNLGEGATGGRRTGGRNGQRSSTSDAKEKGPHVRKAERHQQFAKEGEGKRKKSSLLAQKWKGRFRSFSTYSNKRGEERGKKGTMISTPCANKKGRKKGKALEKGGFCAYARRKKKK